MTTTTTGTVSKKDGRIDLLERLIANAQLTRASKKTDALTAQFATALEIELTERVQALRAEPTQPIQEAA